MTNENLTEMIRAFGAVAYYDHSVSIPELGSVFQMSDNKPLDRDRAGIASAYGVKAAWVSTNGTTPLNVLSLMSVVELGDKVIVQRDSHVSIYAPLIHMGLNPVYITPRYVRDLGVSVGITPLQLRKALDANPDTSAIFLTYPNYFGIATDLEGCIAIAQAYGVPVIVDEAHGSHLHFHPDLPTSAVQTAAAIVTHSTHKTCTAFSQGSVVLFNDDRYLSQFYKVVNQLGFITTSFSYLIFQSVCLALTQLCGQGKELLEEVLQISNWMRSEIKEIEGLSTFDIRATQSGFIAFDSTRVTVDVSRLGLTGFEAEDWLIEHHGIYPELGTLQNVLFLLTLNDDWESGRRIIGALRDLARQSHGNRSIPDLTLPPTPEQVLKPREAFYHRSIMASPVAEAIGMVSAETIATYPPGAAIIVAGERISDEVISFLKASRQHGGILKGASDPDLNTIQILEI